MRALWSDRQNCSHNVSQKVKRIRRFSEEPFLEAYVVLRPLTGPSAWTQENWVLLEWGHPSQRRIADVSQMALQRGNVNFLVWVGGSLEIFNLT